MSIAYDYGKQFNQAEAAGIIHAENDAPIAGYLHAPKTFEVSFQAVKVVTRLIKVLRLFRDIQKRKDIFDQLKLV